MRAVNDLVSEAGATDLGWFIEREADSPWTADADRKQTGFVRFPVDGHGFLRSGNPQNRMLRSRAIAHRFVRLLKPAGVEPVGDFAGALFESLATEKLED